MLLRDLTNLMIWGLGEGGHELFEGKALSSALMLGGSNVLVGDLSEFSLTPPSAAIGNCGFYR